MFEAVDYAHNSPTTGGLGRMRLGATSLFVKLVQSPRHWAIWPLLPPEAQELMTVASVRWRQEVDLYLSDLGQVLPEGMRLPAVHGVVELGDDRVLLFLEDVDADPSPWDTARFASAARLLGRLQARMTRSGPFVAAAQRPVELIEQIYLTRLLPVALPAVTDEATWRHPLLAADRDLRARIVELADLLPGMIERAAALPQLQAHGDTTPHNLLVPWDRPDTFVVIDWAMANLGAVGDDLGQLLIGLAHDGAVAAAELPALRALLVDEYATGLADEGLHIAPETVCTGLDIGLAVRSAFTALPLERLDEPPGEELAALVEQRLALTRFLVELGLDAASLTSAGSR